MPSDVTKVMLLSCSLNATYYTKVGHVFFVSKSGRWHSVAYLGFCKGAQFLHPGQWVGGAKDGLLTTFCGVSIGGMPG